MASRRRGHRRRRRCGPRAAGRAAPPHRSDLTNEAYKVGVNYVRYGLMH
jgi:hypothetical protein